MHTAVYMELSCGHNVHHSVTGVVDAARCNNKVALRMVTSG